MFRQNKLLNMHGGNGGVGGVFKGKAQGQDLNINEIIGKFKSGLEGQIEGTMALKGHQFLLGYVAAYHPSNTLRAIAIREISDPKVLCIIIMSSQYAATVSKAFEKLSGKLGMLKDEDRYMVAMRAPSGALRREALELLRKNFKVIMSAERGRNYEDLLEDIDWGAACINYDVIGDVQMLETKVLESRPFTEEQLGWRKAGFVPENLGVLFSKDLSTL